MKAWSRSFLLFHLNPMRAANASSCWCRTSGSALRGAGFEEEGEEDVEDEALAAVARRRVRGTVLRDEEEIKPAKDVRGSTRGALRAPKEDEEARSRREELVVRFISPLAQIIEFESLVRKIEREMQKKNKKKTKKSPPEKG